MKYLMLLFALYASVPHLRAQQGNPGNEIGTMRVRPAKEISSSTWSIGGETLDRDYTDYQSYRKYLGPLGAKRIRLQGGWAKCEKVKDHYYFEWLDSIVQDAYAQGVAPWIELSYGNPLYAGGGEAKLAGALPTSPEALAAWDRWVKALVNRYKTEVTEWEIWNEPDLAGPDKITGEQYAAFYIRTAELIRGLQPAAKLIAFGLAGPQRIEFAEPLFKKLKEQGKTKLVDIFTYHGYSPNPDQSYPVIEKLRQMVWSYAPHVVFMQGENGAPSTPKAITIGALRDYDWTELTQAKWDLRRMMGDHGRGIATNVFTISDIHYAPGDHMTGINSKGLLKTNPDKTIDRPKLAYKAVQQIFSFFDDSIKADSSLHLQSDNPTQALFSYSQRQSGFSVITVWQNEARPADVYEAKKTTITAVGGKFRYPVFVDLVTGKIYELPRGAWRVSGKQTIFMNVPVPDYPVMITEKSILKIN